MPKATFEQISDLAALEREFDRSASEPVLLFLHDPWCPISAGAYDEMSRLGRRVALVDVSTGHDLSRAIAGRTGVRHESPQLFVLQDGEPRWHASHGRIRAAAVAAAIGEQAETGEAEARRQ